MTQYIYQLKDWPRFTWKLEKLIQLLAKLHHHQGLLIGRMETLGFILQKEASLDTLTLDVVKNSEIENEFLDPDQVRSSIARHLGMDIAALIPSDRNVDGVVEMMLDAIIHCDKPLTEKRLFTWHKNLFPTKMSGMQEIIVANWRNDKKGPMQVVSGPIGREKVHYQAPPAKKLKKEMKAFLTWFNDNQPLDPILKAGIAHLWFVTIHPFADGNGRIARTLSDMLLARADACTQRFYSMSAQIRLERSAYYDVLEKTQKNSLDITDWLAWFLDCLEHSLKSAETNLAKILMRANFWKTHQEEIPFNERQKIMLNKLFHDFYGTLTSSKWAKITKCSQDTALRDIQDLIDRNILIKETGGGRSTSYKLNDDISIAKFLSSTSHSRA